MSFPLNSNETYIKDTGERSTLGKELTSSTYTLPTASSEVKGGVKIGTGLTMTGEVLSVASTSGKLYLHQLLFEHGSSSSTKIAVHLYKTTNTPITKDDMYAFLYNNGTPVTLYGMSAVTSASSPICMAISADLDGSTQRFKYIQPGSTSNNAVTSTVFTDTVFEM